MHASGGPLQFESRDLIDVSGTAKVAGGSTPRQIAKANGDQFYRSPKPCRRCGETKRYTSNGKCFSCTQKYGKSETKRTLDAKYYKKNREAVLAQRAEYRKENREAIREEKNAREAKIRAFLEKARKEGPFEIESDAPREIAAARGQLKYLVKRECPKHPGVFERYTADGKCPICGYVKSAKREALHKEALVPLTPEERKEVDALYAEAKRLAEETGLDHHVDHILPMQKGGIHHPINLRVLPGSENCSKGAKIHWEEITPAIASIHLLHLKPKLSKQTLNKLKQISKRQSLPQNTGVVNSGLEASQ